MPTHLPSDKQDFPPLLEHGHHAMSVAEIRSLCVDGFSQSQTREGIMTDLEQVIQVLDQNQVLGEVWVDGSFVTEKVDPADVDIVLRFPASFYDNASPAQEWLLTTSTR